MMSSIFDMDLPLQQVDFLDQTFDLTAETLAADIQVNEGVLGLDEFQYGALKPQLVEASQDSLDDLLHPDLSSDPLGEDWMEMVDLSNFLDDNTDLPQPVIVDNSSTQTVQKPEEKTSPFEFLKSLLLSGEKLVSTTPVSPEPQVAPQMPLLQEALLRLDNSTTTTEVLKVESAIPLVENNSVIDLNNVQLASPLSTDDIESLLSSPSSPNDNSVTLHTVDASSFTDSGYDNSSDGDSEWVPERNSKSKKAKSRSAPYSTQQSSKKDRKKEQNKNAATRYRVKKKNEKMSLNDEENKLSTINQELKDKVESLQREISYMKDLMNEIYKAKGVKA